MFNRKEWYFKTQYTNRCEDCGKPILKTSKRCKDCNKKYQVGENTSGFKHGKTIAKHCCKDCGVEISDYRHERCGHCRQLGELHPLFTNGKSVNNKCIDCGTKITQYAVRCKSCAAKGEFNVRWNEGSSTQPYPFIFNDELKEKIRNRDEYTCQKCNIAEEEHLTVYGKVLGIHHIDYNKQNCQDENLITLCNECNLRVNVNQNHWKEYFKKLLIKKGV